MKKDGFTLVEILVVIAVVAILGIMVTEIFISSLRGSDKAKVLATIKQNGQAVLETMDKTVRSSDVVVCPLIPAFEGSSPPSDTLVIVRNGVYTRYRFTPENSSGAVNGMVAQDSPQITAPEPVESFINRICQSSDPLVQPIILTDTNPKSGVSLQTGARFIRNKRSGFKDIVNFSFTLKPGVEAASSVLSQTDPVEFTTSIELR